MPAQDADGDVAMTEEQIVALEEMEASFKSV